MKTTKLFFMAALALMTAACSNDDNDLTTQQPQKAEGITITAQLAPKTGGATTRAVSDGGNKIISDWAENEHIAVLYTKDATQYAADATITDVDGSGVATITFTVEAGTPNNTACTLVYPLSAAKDDHSGVKDAATLLAAQDGTLSANLDVRVGEGTIQTTTPGLTVTTQPAAQFAIFKFTVKNSDGSATIDVTSLTVTTGGQDYVITPASATSELYAALPPISSQEVTFTATGSDSKTYTASKASVTFAAGNYYQSNIKLTEQAPVSLIVNPAVGQVIGNDGKNYADAAAATDAGHPAVAIITYVGSDNGEAAPYNHGLAIALADESGTMNWSTAKSTCEGKTAITGAKWCLPSQDQWKQMFAANGGDNESNTGLNTTITTAGGTTLQEGPPYWSSSEGPSVGAYLMVFYEGFAYWYDAEVGYGSQVRACLAF